MLTWNWVTTWKSEQRKMWAAIFRAKHISHIWHNTWKRDWICDYSLASTCSWNIVNTNPLESISDVKIQIFVVLFVYFSFSVLFFFFFFYLSEVWFDRIITFYFWKLNISSQILICTFHFYCFYKIWGKPPIRLRLLLKYMGCSCSICGPIR